MKSVKFLSTLILVTLIFTSNAMANDLPVAKEGETFSWISESYSDEKGEVHSFSGPLILPTEKISKQELIDSCYNETTSEAEKDCLVTFEDVEPDYWQSRKIDQASYDYMENSDLSVFNAYIRLVPMGILNPTDSLLEVIYKYEDLFSAGILSEKVVKAQLMADYTQSKQDRYLAIKDDIDNIPGVSVQQHLPGLDWVQAYIGLESLNNLEALPYVRDISVPDPSVKLETLSVNPPAVLEHIQMHQPYYVSDSGAWSGYYDGLGSSGNPNFSRLTVGIIDPQGFNADHLVFRNGYPPNYSYYRIEGSFNCDLSSCSELANPLTMRADQGPNISSCIPNDLGKCDHGTQLAASILGDLRDEQDSNYPSTDNPGQRNRSGSSPEANAMFFNTVDHPDSLTEAVAEAVVQNVDLISVSAGIKFGNCSGISTYSQAINDAFRAGILSSTAAGNEGHSGSCNTITGSDATAAFTVGATGNGTENSVGDLDDADVWSHSSRGGHYYFGSRKRTIVDMVTPGQICYYPNPVEDDLYMNLCQGPATSHAQPRAASAIINLTHHLTANGMADARLPGVQKALMLGMGSRHFSTSLRWVSGYHTWWGAGYMQMRRLDADGLDNPSGYNFGYSCVSNSTSVIRTVNNGNPLSGDVESFKATAWWYTDNFWTANDIDMYLEEYVNGNWQTLMTDTGSDLKKRVYYNDVGGKTLRLKFVGTDVNGDHNDGGQCSTNQARVYFFFVYEDDDRDDYDGLPNSGIDLL